MPFSGPSSYLSTIDEFIGHWTDVDSALAPSALTLPGPYALADLQSDRTALSDEITDLVEAINVVEGHRTDRDNRKEAIKERMRQLGAIIRGVLAGSSYVGRIPPLIGVEANPGKWLISMRDHRDIWTDINASPPAGFTPPLLLTGAYAVATFTTDTGNLETTFQNLALGEQEVDKELQERDAVYLSIRDQLVRYREAVPGLFPADHPLVLSLPRLTPLPGHTPDPVVLSGVWNLGTLKADLSWTASADPELESYEVRRSGATPYNTNTELVVQTLPPGTLALSTNAGLTLPGSTMGFKVYVVLTTANERGSNAVTITHPGDDT